MLTAIRSIKDVAKLEGVRSLCKDIAIALGASIVIGLAAPVTIALPFSPIPITLQVNLVLFMAAILGARRGGLAVLFFLMQGAMGYPVFAGGAFGLLNLVGPRGGYLLGYLIAAVMVGRLSERAEEKTPLKLFSHMLAGNLLIYMCGSLWLSQFVGIGKALLIGVAPFLPGDALKLFLFTRLGMESKRMG